MMKKWGSAALTAGLSITIAIPAISQAQESVTLYGVLDTGLLFTNKSFSSSGANAGKTFSLIDAGESPSRFGISGSEDLGHGVKAEFKLESGINVANGGFDSSNGNLFGRQAWIAVDGAYGKVTAGLQYSPFIFALFDSDARGFSTFGSGYVIYADAVAVTGVFTANAISYTTPNVGGLQASAMLALGGVAGDFQAGRHYSASIEYNGGAFMINAAIYSSNAGGTQTPVPSTIPFQGKTVGVGYKFQSLGLKASFTNYKVSGSVNNDVYSFGIDYFVRPTININAGVWLTSDRNKTKSHSILGAVGVEDYLSKRTSVYVQAGVVNNHGGMNTGLSATGALYSAPGTTIGVDVGIRHTF
nr:porin [Paraburkholderia steynii]